MKPVAKTVAVVLPAASTEILPDHSPIYKFPLLSIAVQVASVMPVLRGSVIVLKPGADTTPPVLTGPNGAIGCPAVYICGVL